MSTTASPNTFGTHDSPKAWLADFQDRLGTEVAQRLQIDQAEQPYMYEKNQELNLKQIDATDLKLVLFENVFDFEDEQRSLYNENLHNDDVESIHTMLRTVLKDWDKEVSALAKALDLDKDDLKERWLDKDNDDFSPQELNCQFHHNVYEYTNEVTGIVNLQFSITRDFRNDDFWQMLDAFRINAKDMLDALLVEVRDGSHPEVSRDDPDEDRTGPEWDPDNLADDFRSDFLHRQGKVEATQLRSCNRFDADPVVTPYDVLGFIDKHKYGSDNSVSGYLKLHLDGSTVDDFSRKASSHGVNDDDLVIQVMSGYISNTEADGRYDEDSFGILDLRAPMAVRLGDFKVNSDTPDGDSNDALFLPAQKQLHADLQDVQETLFDRTTRSHRAMSDDESEALEVRLATEPRWVVQAERTSFPALEPAITKYLNRTVGLFDQDDLDRALLSTVESMRKDEAPSRVDRDTVETLIGLGATGNATNTVGANALMVASSKRSPLDLIRSLHEVTRDPHVALPDGRNAFSIMMNQVASRVRPNQPNERQREVDHVTWYMDQGMGFTEQQLVQKRISPNTAVDNLLRLDSPLIAQRALRFDAEHRDPELIQDAKDRLLYEAAKHRNPRILSALITDGGNLDGWTSKDTHPITLEASLKHTAASIRYGKQDEADDCDRMIQAARSRNLAMSILDDLTLPKPTARP